MNMVKKLICTVLLSVMALSPFALAGCEKDDEMAEILKQFDLSDPQEIWTGTVNDDFTDDLVIVVMRKTSTYPELELRHFKL
jgi:hypothetical protein